MAGSCAWQRPYQNPLLAGEDKFFGAAPGAFTNDNNTTSHTSAVSRIQTPTPAPLFTPAKLVIKSTIPNLQKTTRLALELFV